VRRDRAHTPDEIVAPHSAVDAREEQHFLRQLRGRSAVLNLKLYSEWMGAHPSETFLISRRRTKTHTAPAAALPSFSRRIH
jgi:hypothetical protein